METTPKEQVQAPKKPVEQSAPRPIVKETAAREISLAEKVIKERICEYASAVSSASIPSNRRAEYGSLHAAFRSLMATRNEEFLHCFKAFINCIRDAKSGKDGMHPTAFAGNVYGANLGLFSDTDEGRAFIAFMVLAVSFSRTANPEKFTQDKNIGRLTDLISDQELVKIIYDAFAGK